MRLKEPLQGVKLVAQGHFMIHLALFITSLYVQIKIWKNPHDPYLNPTAEFE